MKVLVIGAGGVGSAFTDLAASSEAIESVVVADIDQQRAKRAVARVQRPNFIAIELDASSTPRIAEAARYHEVDYILNACDPRFVMPIFRAALEAKVNYVDMAMSLSHPHPNQPYSKAGVLLGDEQFALASEFEERGLLALVGMGVEPGLSDVFARYAADELFSHVDSFDVRDGANLQVDGFEFAPTFSIWTTIEECLNPPLLYERDRGHFTTVPFSEPETFCFPEGIGNVECVNVEHEEVVLIPRYLDAGRVTFKYGLGDEFISVLKSIHKLGLDRIEPVQFRGHAVSPRDFLASLLPDPTTLGDKMTGKTCAGTWVQGLDKAGKQRSTYLYHVVDNEETMRRWGAQAVVWQTAINPLIALELLESGTWSGSGVHGPEYFPAQGFLEGLVRHNSPWGMVELKP
ncbi:MAG: saccharopine dehydrogenase C-terminal domain-containing protein [Acidimicrobiales bacterium]